MSLSDSGIIDRANEAVDKSNAAQMQQIAQLAWSDAYIEYGGNIEGNKDAVKAKIKAALESNGYELDDYGIAVTNKGVTVGWVQSGLTVVKGDTTLTLGDVVNYDETNGGEVTGLKDLTWVVLGEEDGKLLLIATDNLATALKLEGSAGYLNGPQRLNDLCKVYGEGEKAELARSVKIEDINDITGYNPNKTGTGYAYAGEIVADKDWEDYENKYGTEVTHSLDAQGNVVCAFTAPNGQAVSATSDFKVFKKLDGTDMAAGEKLTQTSDYYHYYSSTLTTSNTDTVKGQIVGSKIYTAIGPNGGFWCASQCKEAGSKGFVYQLFIASRDRVTGVTLWNTRTGAVADTHAVRPVIVLEADTIFTETATNSGIWNIG